MSSWQKLSSKTVYSNKWMKVKEDAVINPAGKKTIYGYYSLLNKFLYVVPIDKNFNTYLVQQYRYPLGEKTWEFIAGHTDGEEPEKAAKRELLEEAGLTTNKLNGIGNIYANAALSDAVGPVFIAHDVKRVTKNLDPEDGIIRLLQLPLSRVGIMINEGEIKSPYSISAYFMAMEYLKEMG